MEQFTGTGRLSKQDWVPFSKIALAKADLGPTEEHMECLGRPRQQLSELMLIKS